MFLSEEDIFPTEAERVTKIGHNVEKMGQESERIARDADILFQVVLELARSVKKMQESVNSIDRFVRDNFDLFSHNYQLRGFNVGSPTINDIDENLRRIETLIKKSILKVDDRAVARGAWIGPHKRQ